MNDFLNIHNSSSSIRSIFSYSRYLCIMKIKKRFMNIGNDLPIFKIINPLIRLNVLRILKYHL